MSGVTLVGKLQIKDGGREKFDAVAKKVMAAVANNPGVTRYEWYVNDDGEVMAVENYANDDAVIAHVTGEAGALLPELFQFADVQSIDMYGVLGEKASEVVASFPITHRGTPAFSVG